MEIKNLKIIGLMHQEALATPTVSKAVHREKQGCASNDLDWAEDAGKIIGVVVKPHNTDRFYIVPFGLIIQIQVESPSKSPIAKKVA